MGARRGLKGQRGRRSRTPTLRHYFGSTGNGLGPAPYTYDPAYTTKDGWAFKTADLNLATAVSDYRETVIRRAVPWPASTWPPKRSVLPHHLCYALGRLGSRAWPKPSGLLFAIQRIDNSPRAFLEGRGPGAVIRLYGMGGARALFSTACSRPGSVDPRDLWRLDGPHNTAPRTSFARTRSPG